VTVRGKEEDFVTEQDRHEKAGRRNFE